MHFLSFQKQVYGGRIMYPLLPPTFTPNISYTNDELSSKKGILCLGLDLSLTCTGYSIIYIEKKLKPPQLVEIGHIITNKEQEIGERLYYIENSLNSILERYPNLKHISKENGFSRYNTVTAVLNQALGVCLLTIFKNNHKLSAGYSPKTVKKMISGNGNNSKEELIPYILKYLDLPESFTFTNLDESDSVAVALTHLLKKNLIQETPWQD
jgi:crossover junction endodeoxyribonuclease RuvC